MASKRSEASLVHALFIIFLEYFSWGLLTVPVINVLADTFPSNKFLMNGLILGLKGILSFLSSPLIGAFSDVCGRKPFLLLTVFFTCMPIPFLKISPWWYFTLFTISGLFSVTFSVVLAYVADITEANERTTACGLVSATFAASLVTSPALGAYLGRVYSDDVVVLLATLIAVLDLLFILCCVPESRKKPQTVIEGINNGFSANPFIILRFLRDEQTILRLSVITFLSYLPEAGQFSCFFVYLRLVVGFSAESVALFIAFVGVLSVLSQTGILLLVTQKAGPKSAITMGLIFQFVQLVWYGLGSAHWIMWVAGLFAALSQMTYPAISAFVSLQTNKELQGTVQGILSGIRGLCQGMGPAVFGLIFYAFGMDLTSDAESAGHIGLGPQFPVPNIRLQSPLIPDIKSSISVSTKPIQNISSVPGPPFLCGALLVIFALLINFSLPHRRKLLLMHRRSGSSKFDTTALLIDDNEICTKTPIDDDDDDERRKDAEE
ncbi:MFS domain-containing protein [Meloidogyne graminicola]|uniref:MFS domain-containing protein n=1 Tax=Meloidogyne graminicola TaxID=189291 RepID=A0A8S9ZE82_9BILA|nr:MFS domain-containing protein [Meloidogyne graminicola]